MYRRTQKEFAVSPILRKQVPEVLSENERGGFGLDFTYIKHFRSRSCLDFFVYSVYHLFRDNKSECLSWKT